MPLENLSEKPKHLFVGTSRPPTHPPGCHLLFEWPLISTKQNKLHEGQNPSRAFRLTKITREQLDKTWRQGRQERIGSIFESYRRFRGQPILYNLIQPPIICVPRATQTVFNNLDLDIPRSMTPVFQKN